MQLFSLSVLIVRKDFVSLQPQGTALCRFIDILNSEAQCFILTKREPENFQDEDGECGTVVSALTGADFCHIPPSRFLRTSVEEYQHEVCDSVYKYN